MKPSKDVNVDNDDELDAWIRATGETLYHPVGTCKMGSDKMAVTNEHGRCMGWKACAWLTPRSCRR